MFYTFDWIRKPFFRKNFRPSGKGQEGFSLVESMICLMILGILGGVLLPLFKQFREIKTWEVTQAHRERIFYALAAFVATKGRLPFPSPPPETFSFGEENPRSSSEPYLKGFVPFKTLGLSEAVSKDGEKKFFLYVVHPQLTFTKTPRDYCEKEILHLIPVGSSQVLPFDPVAVVLISPQKGREGKNTFEEDFWAEGEKRWETRRNLVAFYGRLFYIPSLS